MTKIKHSLLFALFVSHLSTFLTSSYSPHRLSFFLSQRHSSYLCLSLSSVYIALPLPSSLSSLSLCTSSGGGGEVSERERERGRQHVVALTNNAQSKEDGGSYLPLHCVAAPPCCRCVDFAFCHQRGRPQVVAASTPGEDIPGGHAVRWVASAHHRVCALRL